MPAILLVTLSPEQREDEESLIRQLARWRIRGDAELKFLARTTASQSASTMTRLCAEFAHFGGAGDFVAEFRRGATRPEPERMFEILLSEGVPEIEALPAAI